MTLEQRAEIREYMLKFMATADSIVCHDDINPGLALHYFAQSEIYKLNNPKQKEVT